MLTARSIRITGHVQGVFFREWTVTVAKRIGVTGWVRNRNDGGVEIYAAGEPDDLDEFVTELRGGSPASRVDGIRITPADLEPISGFVRRSTL